MRATAFLLALSLAAAAELPDDDWKQAQGRAGRLMGKAGRLNEKRLVIQTAARDNSKRAVQLFAKWLHASQRLQRGRLKRDVDKTRKAFEKIERRMQRDYGRTPPPSRESGARAQWYAKKREYDTARSFHDVEAKVRSAIAAGIARLRSADALAALYDTRDRATGAAWKLPEFRAAVLQCLWLQPPGKATDRILAFAADEQNPKGRLAVLDWIGREQVERGVDAAAGCLHARESLVRRAAIRTLRRLDRPEAVPALVEGLRSARGLVAQEMEDALHYFTGQPFSGVGAPTMWARWWAQSGEVWLASASAQRYREKLKGKGRATARFYGIPTRSHRIVFVLDRSDSMKRPVPKPVASTGPGKTPVAGETRLEAAKHKLASAIAGLVKDVKFGVIFYSTTVKTWKKPPRLLEATPANKAGAKSWFMGLDPRGNTQLFEALIGALKYADTLDGKVEGDKAGADTIFLLSDGSPTYRKTGKVLSAEDLEQEYLRFRSANHKYRCVVHTIGIGPNHNARLMRRIAEETGGTYTAVRTGR